MFKRFQIGAGLLVAAFGLVLSGCSGTSTYGTGTTQEAQLADDLLSIASIGGKRQKKKPINYTARPTLVKPSNVASLPAPSEKLDDTAAGYYPETPEEKRARLVRLIDEAEKNGTPLPEEALAMRAQSSANAKLARGAARDRVHRGTDYVVEKYDPGIARRQREEFLKQKAKIAGVQGAAPRKYLTEPPKQYRTPASTAPIGEVGEKESDPYKKKEKNNLWDWLKGDEKKKS